MTRKRTEVERAMTDALRVYSKFTRQGNQQWAQAIREALAEEAAKEFVRSRQLVPIDTGVLKMSLTKRTRKPKSEPLPEVRRAMRLDGKLP